MKLNPLDQRDTSEYEAVVLTKATGAAARAILRHETADAKAAHTDSRIPKASPYIRITANPTENHKAATNPANSTSPSAIQATQNTTKAQNAK